MNYTLKCIFCVLAASIATVLVLYTIGCSEKHEGHCTNSLKDCAIVSEKNLSGYLDACEKLAKCMKATEFHMAHLTNQPHNPWACSITVDKRRSRYLYPEAEITFDEIWPSNLKNAIAVCEMMTHTGEFSDKYLDDLDALFRRMDKERKEREHPAPTPTPRKIKIMEAP